MTVSAIVCAEHSFCYRISIFNLRMIALYYALPWTWTTYKGQVWTSKTDKQVPLRVMRNFLFIIVFFAAVEMEIY